MNILPLFCEIDDFFLRLNNIRHNDSSPGNAVKNVAARERCIPARS